jgi:hypothetical protein
MVNRSFCATGSTREDMQVFDLWMNEMVAELGKGVAVFVVCITALNETQWT